MVLKFRQYLWRLILWLTSEVGWEVEFELQVYPVAGLHASGRISYVIYPSRIRDRESLLVNTELDIEVYNRDLLIQVWSAEKQNEFGDITGIGNRRPSISTYVFIL